MNWIGMVMIAAGSFAICGAAFDWDFFMNSRKAQFWIMLLGRPGTRIFYGLLGAIVVVVGVLAMLGMIESRNY